MVPRVGETVGTSNACPSMPMIDRVQATPSSAVMIGTIIATALPNASRRMMIAAPIPMISLTWVDGLDTSCPR